MTYSELGERIASLATARDSPGHVRGHVGKDRAASLLSPNALGRHLRNPLLRALQIRVAVDGRGVSAFEYTMARKIGTTSIDDAVDEEKIGRLLARGATLTFDALELVSPEIAEVCEVLTGELGLEVTASAYVTPPAQQGLRPHTDEEDVFVVQTAGKKSWRVADDFVQDVPLARALPGDYETSRGLLFTLEAGDAFFMPAGTPHVAEALPNDGLSIHITFSAERPRIYQWLAKHFEREALRDPLLMRLRPWRPGRMKVADVVGERASQLLDTMSTPSPRASVFDDWDALRASRVEIVLVHPVTLESDSTAVRLRFPSFAVKAPPGIVAALETVFQCGRDVVDLEANPGVRSILFQLAGRGAISIRSAATS